MKKKARINSLSVSLVKDEMTADLEVSFVIPFLASVCFSSLPFSLLSLNRDSNIVWLEMKKKKKKKLIQLQIDIK